MLPEMGKKLVFRASRMETARFKLNEERAATEATRISVVGLSKKKRGLSPNESVLRALRSSGVSGGSRYSLGTYIRVHCPE